MGGTTKDSGWALFWFLLGFTIFGSAAAGGGVISFCAGFVLMAMSFAKFKAIRVKEGA